MAKARVIRRLRRVFGLLSRLQPERSRSDVRWSGPFFIPRQGAWWPTRFIRYRSELHCTVELGRSAFTLVWDLGADGVRFQGEPHWSGGYRNDAQLWERVLEQVERRLLRALANPSAYNRRVARQLPLRCRTGRIQRKFTWPRGARPSMERSELGRLESALESGKRARSWHRLSLRRYLEVAAVAYDAVLPDLRMSAPRKKYERRADGRHGGLLHLKPTDDRAFERWYKSRKWIGSHPWEIVFGHPHGVLLSPRRDAGRWRFVLAVDAPGLYVVAARMAIALSESGVPFELTRADELLAALRGDDWLEVGPFHGQIALDELDGLRTDAASHVVWDNPPKLLRKARR